MDECKLRSNAKGVVRLMLEFEPKKRVTLKNLRLQKFFMFECCPSGLYEDVSFIAIYLLHSPLSYGTLLILCRQLLLQKVIFSLSPIFLQRWKSGLFDRWNWVVRKRLENEEEWECWLRVLAWGRSDGYTNEKENNLLEEQLDATKKYQTRAGLPYWDPPCTTIFTYRLLEENSKECFIIKLRKVVAQQKAPSLAAYGTF